MERFYQLWHRVTACFSRGRLEQDLRDEMSFHIEMREEQLRDRHGLDAPSASRRRFGNEMLLREETRSASTFPVVDQVLADIRFALRTIRRAPGFGAAVVLILALAIGVNTAVFSVVNAVLLRPPYPDSERLVGIDSRDRSTGRYIASGIAPGLMRDLQESGAFEGVAISALTRRAWIGAGEPELIAGLMVSERFFDVLGVPTSIGRSFSVDEMNPGGEQTVILTDDLFQRRFGGDSGVLGESAIIGGQPHAIIGVMPRDFVSPDGSDIQFLVPLVPSPEEFDRHGSDGYVPYARVDPALSLDEARIRTNDLAERLGRAYPETNQNRDLVLVSVFRRMNAEYRRSLAFLQLGAGLVLLVACANLAGILLARTDGRRDEIRTRTALGAGRSRLMGQILVEGLVFAVAGGSLGLVVGSWLGRAMPALLSLNWDIPGLNRIGIDLSVVAFATCATVVSGVCFSLVPVFHATRGGTIGERLTGRSARHRDRQSISTKGLLTAQVAVTVLLLILAGLTTNSITRMFRVDPGFETSGLLTAYVQPDPSLWREDPAAAVSFYKTLGERIREVPGIEAAALTTGLHMTGSFPGFYDAASAGATLRAVPRVVDSAYFRTLRVPILRGRDFDDTDTASVSRVAIVNETLARQVSADGDVLGTVISIDLDGQDPTAFTIVGVAQDMFLDARAGPVSDLFIPIDHYPLPLTRAYIVARSSLPSETLAQPLREEVWSIDPAQPIAQIASLDDLIWRSHGYSLFRGYLQTMFAFLALLLAAVGIYGAFSYAISQRQRSIAVRMALGAEPQAIQWQVLREAAVPVLTGTGVGVTLSAVLARYVRRSLGAVLFEIGPLDVATYALAALLLIVVALAASFIPARRASRVDPFITLRHE